MPGDVVRVDRGPLESVTGLFDGIADKERVIVLLDMVGRKTRAVLNLSSVAPA